MSVIESKILTKAQRKSIPDEKRVNQEVSRLVHKKIYNTDSRLIAWLIKNKARLSDEMKPHIFKIPSMVESLRRALN